MPNGWKSDIVKSKTWHRKPTIEAKLAHAHERGNKRTQSRSVSMSSHTFELNLNKARVKALALVALMVLSTSLAAMDVAASNSKQYPVTRNPLDLATGDFDCDGDDDIVTASEMGNFLSILWNDGGTYQDRSDIWVSNNNTRRAGFTSIADVGGVEVGDIDDDDDDDDEIGRAHV